MRSKPSQYWLYIKSSCFESQNAQIKAHTRKRDLKNAQHNRKRIRARDQTALSDQNILYSFVWNQYIYIYNKRVVIVELYRVLRGRVAVRFLIELVSENRIVCELQCGIRWIFNVRQQTNKSTTFGSCIQTAATRVTFMTSLSNTKSRVYVRPTIKKKGTNFFALLFEIFKASLDNWFSKFNFNDKTRYYICVLM